MQHIANGFQLELYNIANPPKGQGYGGFHELKLTYSQPCDLISICEMEMAKSDICSIPDIFFSWEKKISKESKTDLTSNIFVVSETIFQI